MQDDHLKSYARTYLRAREANHVLVDAFVDSDAFTSLVAVLNSNLVKSMDKFKNGQQPAQQPADPVENSPKDRAGAAPSETDHDAPAKVAPAISPMEFPVLVPAQPAKPADVTKKPDLSEMQSRVAAANNEVPAPDNADTAAAAETRDADSVAPELKETPPAAAAKPLSTNRQSASTAAPQAEPADIAFRLQNAKAGEPYSQKLLPVPESAPAVVFTAIAIPDGVPLVGNKNTGAITGTPEAPGEHDIAVTYHFAAQPSSRQRRAIVKLTVNPDPKSMWKNLASDRNDVFWKEDEDCSIVTGPEFRMLAASKRGRSHAHVGSFRDDDYLIDHLDAGGWYIAVVSDGAGSARYSRRGSQIICDAASRHLRQALNSDDGKAVDQAAENFYNARSQEVGDLQMQGVTKQLQVALYKTVGYAAYHALKAVMQECDSRAALKASYRDFSSTAIISVCKRYSFGVLCVAYWVGDGAVAIYSQNQGVTLLGDVDSGEYSGQTRFLDSNEVTQEALLKRTRFELVDDITALILMTDGVSDPKFETESRLARSGAWDELWREMDREVGLSNPVQGVEKKLLGWLDFWSQGNHDDRTIAIVYQG